jgi:hypothetical protein
LAQNALGGQFDRPQWQGPDRTAHSKETGLLKQWPKEGPPFAWKIKGLGGVFADHWPHAKPAHFTKCILVS